MHRTFRFTTLALVLLAALVLAACSPTPDTQSESPLGTPPSAPQDTPSPAPGSGQETDAVASARAELASLLGIAADSIQLVSVEQVEWPDTSLGCPQEGQMYAQVIVPGQRIVLEAGGQQYEYHTGDGNVILCQDGTGTPPEATPAVEIDPAAAPLVEQAKQELSTRASVAVDDITVQSVEAVQWRDSSLGCPKPGMQYLQVITPGYRIVLEAAGQVYEYHTDRDTVVYCENPESPAPGDAGVN